jgi:hypothetical protein
MNQTLFSEVQRLFEKTYASVGINLEDCSIERAARSSRGWPALPRASSAS